MQIKKFLGISPILTPSESVKLSCVGSDVQVVLSGTETLNSMPLFLLGTLAKQEMVVQSVEHGTGNHISYFCAYHGPFSRSSGLCPFLFHCPALPSRNGDKGKILFLSYSRKTLVLL